MLLSHNTGGLGSKRSGPDRGSRQGVPEYQLPLPRMKQWILVLFAVGRLKRTVQ